MTTSVEQRRDASATAHSMRSEQVSARRPLLVYVNIPFCNAKCHFCCWVAEVPRADLRLTPADSSRSRYIEAVTEQIKAHSPLLRRAGYQPRLMYWGGGTASILTGDEMRRIFEPLQAELDLSQVVEATLEGSPESLDLDKCRLTRSLGFNRVSIGVQTFDDARLRKIGRVHSASQAATAVEAAAAAGFDNINIDLIVGFPGQPHAEIKDNVRIALSLPVNHVSVYVYHVTPGTVMSRQIERGLPATDPVEQVEQYCLVRDMLAAAGFAEYAAGYMGSPPCQAEMAYYALTMDWIGFGSGAGSLLGQRHIANARDGLHRYNQDPTVFDVNIPASTEAVVLKGVFQALGTHEGVRANRLERRLGIPLAEARELPLVKAYLENVQRYGQLISDEVGIRLRREDLVRAWYLSRPGSSQGAQD
jgi:putative oxygen-independent coproporphyrinogen III oxidase